MTKRKKPAKIVAADIKFISLCFEGKTGIRGLYKSKGEDIEVEVLHKAKDLGEGRLLTVIYPPNKLDDDQHWADQAGIQAMIESFARNGGKIDVEHDGQPVDAYLVESFTIQEGDPRFEDFEGPVAGGWGGILQIDDEEYKEKYANGDWGGVSVAGEGVLKEGLEPVQKANTKPLKKLINRMLRAFGRDEGTGVTGLHLSVNLTEEGETDYLGNPAKDSFHISLNGNLHQ